MAASTVGIVSTTPYYAKYDAQVLSRRQTGDSVDQLASSLADAVVHVKPHQIETVLFAIQSPLSNGAILAHEVALYDRFHLGVGLCVKPRKWHHVPSGTGRYVS